MGSGGGTSFPEPSKEELELRKEETELLRFQRSVLEENIRIQDLLSPFMFEDAGLQPVFDEEGNIESFNRIEDPNEVLREEIETSQLQRSAQALRGELPINPALTRDFEEGETTLRETLLKQLGPGFETSSPGIEALGDFGERRSIVEEGARRDDLSLFEQLSLGRQAAGEASGTNTLNRLLGINRASTAVAGNPSGGFAGVANLFAQDRQLQAQISAQNSRNRSSTLQSLFSAAGTIAGGFAGGPGGAALGSSIGSLFGGGGGGGGGGLTFPARGAGFSF